MAPIWVNRPVTDDEERRTRLYAGEIFVYDRLRSVQEFAMFTREMVEAAFAPLDPRHAHEALTPAELAPVLGRLKPQYTHHPEARRLVIGILQELGVDLEDAHLDVPKLRTAYPAGHLTKGVAYAFGAHRDTWYGGPQAQINWWLPIYPLAADNAMAFYPRYFATPMANDSARFNYYRRNVERRDLTKFVDEDPRVQPAAIGLGPDEPEVRLLASLSRYSVDFRTVSRRDVELGLGAPNVDACCTGTALRDFRRASDAAAMREELARLLDPVGPAQGEVAVFTPGA
jgi:hypothetical protein